MMKKTDENEEDELEKQLIASEKAADCLEKILKQKNRRNSERNKTPEEKEQQKKQREEKKRQKKIQEKIEIIENDLTEQLQNQNKFGKHFEDMVKDYLFFVKLKEDLQHDIDVNGIRYEAKTGNGYKTDKPNESVNNLIKVNAQMLKILQDLDLKDPEKDPEEGDGDDLL